MYSEIFFDIILKNAPIWEHFVSLFLIKQWTCSSCSNDKITATQAYTVFRRRIHNYLLFLLNYTIPVFFNKYEYIFCDCFIVTILTNVNIYGEFFLRTMRFSRGFILLLIGSKSYEISYLISCEII